MRWGRLGIAASIVLALLLASACSSSNLGDDLTLEREGASVKRELVAKAAEDEPAEVAATAAEPAMPIPLPPTTTTAPPPPPPPPPPTTTTAPPPPPPPAPPRPKAGHVDLNLYAGLGTWVDVYDWSTTFGRGGPLVEPTDVDRMADAGVETLYIQASKWDSPTDVLEPERLLAFVDRAHARGMDVVAWYLPTLEDPAFDLRRLLAIAALPVDAVAVDIESRKVADVAERNRRLIELSGALRTALPRMTIGAIPFPPVVMEVINPSFWPGFPWRELAPLYDVWLPMSYQSDRKSSSGYRDGYRYTSENIDRMRANLGLPDAPIHTIGGIADATSPEDVTGIVRAAVERRAIGGSLYDWRTTGPHLWEYLQPFRSGR